MEVFATPDVGFPMLQCDVGGYKNFHYVIACPRTKKGAIIDPAFALPEVFEAAAAAGIRIEQAIFTHAHWDHINGLPDVMNMGVRKIIIHAAAAEHPLVKEAMPRVHFVTNGETWTLGDLQIRAIHTPGHQPESTCYVVGQALPTAIFTGDTLFIDKCGRTDFPGGNTQEMFESMQKLRHERGSLWVFCGHNYHAKAHDTLSNQWRTNPAMTLNRGLFDDLDCLRD